MERKAASEIKKDSDTDNVGANQLICLYRKTYQKMNLKLVQLDLNVHFLFMHQGIYHTNADDFWFNNPDAIKFFDYYEEKIKANEEIMLMAYLDELPIAQVAISPARTIAFSGYYNAGLTDLCLHILMGPYRELIKKVDIETNALSSAVLQAVLEYLFYNAKATNVLMAPDKENKKACAFAKLAGFRLYDIPAIDNTTALYVYTRADFLKKWPQPQVDKKLNLFADRFKQME